VSASRESEPPRRGSKSLWRLTFGREDWGDRIAVVVVIVLIIAAMEIGSRFVPDYILPAPLAILEALVQFFTHDLGQIVVTLLRLAMAVVFSMLVGTLIGALMGMLPALRPFLSSLMIIDTGIPALSWMLIAIFWFKDAEIRIFFILTVILLPFYAMNVHEGIRALPKDWLEMVESFRPSRWQVLRYLITPHIAAYILLTTKSVIGYATRMVIFAELIGATVGIGTRMGLAEATFRIDQVFAWTVFLVALNAILQVLVSAAEKRLLRWRPELEVR